MYSNGFGFGGGAGAPRAGFGGHAAAFPPTPGVGGGGASILFSPPQAARAPAGFGGASAAGAGGFSAGRPSAAGGLGGGGGLARQFGGVAAGGAGGGGSAGAGGQGFGFPLMPGVTPVRGGLTGAAATPAPPPGRGRASLGGGGGLGGGFNSQQQQQQQQFTGGTAAPAFFKGGSAGNVRFNNRAASAGAAAPQGRGGGGLAGADGGAAGGMLMPGVLLQPQQQQQQVQSGGLSRTPTLQRMQRLLPGQDRAGSGGGLGGGMHAQPRAPRFPAAGGIGGVPGQPAFAALGGGEAPAPPGGLEKALGIKLLGLPPQFLDESALAAFFGAVGGVISVRVNTQHGFATVAFASPAAAAAGKAAASQLGARVNFWYPKGGPGAAAGGPGALPVAAAGGGGARAAALQQQQQQLFFQQQQAQQQEAAGFGFPGGADAGTGMLPGAGGFGGGVVAGGGRRARSAGAALGQQQNQQQQQQQQFAAAVPGFGGGAAAFAPGMAAQAQQPSPTAAFGGFGGAAMEEEEEEEDGGAGGGMAAAAPAAAAFSPILPHFASAPAPPTRKQQQQQQRQANAAAGQVPVAAVAAPRVKLQKAGAGAVMQPQEAPAPPAARASPPAAAAGQRPPLSLASFRQAAAAAAPAAAPAPPAAGGALGDRKAAAAAAMAARKAAAAAAAAPPPAPPPAPRAPLTRGRGPVPSPAALPDDHESVEEAEDDETSEEEEEEEEGGEAVSGEEEEEDGSEEDEEGDEEEEEEEEDDGEALGYELEDGLVSAPGSGDEGEEEEEEEDEEARPPTPLPPDQAAALGLLALSPHGTQLAASRSLGAAVKRTPQALLEVAASTPAEPGDGLIGLVEAMCPSTPEGGASMSYKQKVSFFEHPAHAPGGYTGAVRVRSHARSAAGDMPDTPECTRSVPALLRVTDYLFFQCADADREGRVFLGSDGQEVPAVHHTASFLSDRLRQVSRELGTLNYVEGGRADPLVLEALERSVRAILLLSFEASDDDAFAPHFKDTHAVVTGQLKNLIELYDYANDRTVPGVFELTSPNEAEFRAYYLLTFLADPGAALTVVGALQGLALHRPHVLSAPLLRHAIAITSAVACNNYRRLWRLIRSPLTNFCMVSIIQRQLVMLRGRALGAINRALGTATGKAIPIADVQEMLAMDSEAAAVNLVDIHGLELRRTPLNGGVGGGGGGLAGAKRKHGDDGEGDGEGTGAADDDTNGAMAFFDTYEKGYDYALVAGTRQPGRPQGQMRLSKEALLVDTTALEETPRAELITAGGWAYKRSARLTQAAIAPVGSRAHVLPAFQGLPATHLRRTTPGILSPVSIKLAVDALAVAAEAGYGEGEEEEVGAEGSGASEGEEGGVTPPRGAPAPAPAVSSIRKAEPPPTPTTAGAAGKAAAASRRRPSGGPSALAEAAVPGLTQQAAKLPGAAGTLASLPTPAPALPLLSPAPTDLRAVSGAFAVPAGPSSDAPAASTTFSFGSPWPAAPPAPAAAPAAASAPLAPFAAPAFSASFAFPGVEAPSQPAPAPVAAVEAPEPSAAAKAAADAEASAAAAAAIAAYFSALHESEAPTLLEGGPGAEEESEASGGSDEDGLAGYAAASPAFLHGASAGALGLHDLTATTMTTAVTGIASLPRQRGVRRPAPATAATAARLRAAASALGSSFTASALFTGRGGGATGFEGTTARLPRRPLRGAALLRAPSTEAAAAAADETLAAAELRAWGTTTTAAVAGAGAVAAAPPAAVPVARASAAAKRAADLAAARHFALQLAAARARRVLAAWDGLTRARRQRRELAHTALAGGATSAAAVDATTSGGSAAQLGKLRRHRAAAATPASSAVAAAAALRAAVAATVSVDVTAVDAEALDAAPASAASSAVAAAWAPLKLQAPLIAAVARAGLARAVARMAAAPDAAALQRAIPRRLVFKLVVLTEATGALGGAATGFPTTGANVLATARRALAESWLLGKLAVSSSSSDSGRSSSAAPSPAKKGGAPSPKRARGVWPGGDGALTSDAFSPPSPPLTLLSVPGDVTRTLLLEEAGNADGGADGGMAALHASLSRHCDPSSAGGSLAASTIALACAPGVTAAISKVTPSDFADAPETAAAGVRGATALLLVLHVHLGGGAGGGAKGGNDDEEEEEETTLRLGAGATLALQADWSSARARLGSALLPLCPDGDVALCVGVVVHGGLPPAARDSSSDAFAAVTDAVAQRLRLAALPEALVSSSSVVVLNPAALGGAVDEETDASGPGPCELAPRVLGQALAWAAEAGHPAPRAVSTSVAAFLGTLVQVGLDTAAAASEAAEQTDGGGSGGLTALAAVSAAAEAATAALLGPAALRHHNGRELQDPDDDDDDADVAVVLRSKRRVGEAGGAAALPPAWSGGLLGASKALVLPAEANDSGAAGGASNKKAAAALVASSRLLASCAAAAGGSCVTPPFAPLALSAALASAYATLDRVLAVLAEEDTVNSSSELVTVGVSDFTASPLAGRGGVAATALGAAASAAVRWALGSATVLHASPALTTLATELDALLRGWAFDCLAALLSYLHASTLAALDALSLKEKLAALGVSGGADPTPRLPPLPLLPPLPWAGLAAVLARHCVSTAAALVEDDDDSEAAVLETTPAILRTALQAAVDAAAAGVGGSEAPGCTTAAHSDPAASLAALAPAVVPHVHAAALAGSGALSHGELLAVVRHAAAPAAPGEDLGSSTTAPGLPSLAGEPEPLQPSAEAAALLGSALRFAASIEQAAIALAAAAATGSAAAAAGAGGAAAMVLEEEEEEGDEEAAAADAPAAPAPEALLARLAGKLAAERAASAAFLDSLEAALAADEKLSARGAEALGGGAAAAAPGPDVASVLPLLGLAPEPAPAPTAEASDDFWALLASTQAALAREREGTQALEVALGMLAGP